ncbi:MAG: choice-of-anchor Q domain-containing protein [Phycisphaerales bacterium]|nr:hypothetical protein [Planctomycetota bacterium]
MLHLSGARFVALGSLLLGELAHAGTTRYVAQSLASGANDGSSWSNAFRGPLSLQAALASAQAGDEIWVAADVYRPALPGGTIASTFQMKEGVRIYGGFAGGESLLAERNIALHATTISGDLNNDESLADNVAHVVTATGLSNLSVLDGFTITRGHAVGGGNDGLGAGVLVVGGAPVIRNCSFTDNIAQSGGGIGANGAAALIDSCAFGPNFAHNGFAVCNISGDTSVVSCTFQGLYPATGGASGLGIWSGQFSTNAPSASLLVEDCTFSIQTPNFTCPAGIAIAGEVAQATIRRSDFLGNTGCGSGAIQLEGTINIDRCRFIGNEGTFDGGAALHSFHGVYSVTNSLFAGNDRLGFSTIMVGTSMTLINCTLASNGNTVQNSAGGGFHRVVTGNAAQFRATNCIFWNNRSRGGDADAVVVNSSPAPQFDFCLVQNWGALSVPATGFQSFTGDPKFVSLTGPDGLTGTIDDDYRLASGSPAIDRGTNLAMPLALDIFGLPRFRNDPSTADFLPGPSPEIDLGAWEFAPPCPADLTGDGQVDDTDFVLFAAAYDRLLCSDPDMPAGCPSDLNADALVDDIDFVLFAAAYNTLGCE